MPNIHPLLVAVTVTVTVFTVGHYRDLLSRCRDVNKTLWSETKIRRDFGF